jgi:hypothetical protein
LTNKVSKNKTKNRKRKDKFLAQSGGESAAFERDKNGKIVGVIIITGSSRVLKGKRIN